METNDQNETAPAISLKRLVRQWRRAWSQNGTSCYVRHDGAEVFGGGTYWVLNGLIFPRLHLAVAFADQNL